MKRESKIKIFSTWVDEIWEEVEIQFYGILGAIIFFIVVYLFFHPSWMKPLIDFFYRIKITS